MIGGFSQGDFTYLIFVIIFGLIIFPIFFLLFLNLNLFFQKSKLLTHIFYSTIFLIIFFLLRYFADIPENRNLLLTVYEIEAILSIPLIILTVILIKKINNNRKNCT